MSKSSKNRFEQQYKRLGERAAAHEGSVWDVKIHEPTGLTYADLRYKVGASVVQDGWGVREAAEHFSVSVGFVAKWSGVFRDRKTINDGTKHDSVLAKDAFGSLTNRPKNVVTEVRDSYREKVVSLRTELPFLGSRKIKEMGNIDASPSTIDKIIREEGLASPYLSRHTKKHYGSFEKARPFDMVQIDFKTWDNGLHSIFVIDDCSRAIINHIISEKHTAEVVIEVLEMMYRTWHVYPKCILSDHGTEFYNVSGKGKSVLDIWCEERNIKHAMGRVRHPQTQGKIERSHLSAEREIRYFGKFDTLEHSKETMRKWVEFYNMIRPHQSLGYKRPFEVFFEKLHGKKLDEFISA